MQPTENSHSYDCLIAGAGIAGLVAARTLADAGLSVLVIEARDRVGGRLLTLHAEGEDTPIELGAEFVHGRPPELLALLEEAQLPFYETSGVDMRYMHGQLSAISEEDGAFALLEELTEPDDYHDSEDQTFDEFLSTRNPPEAVANRARRYVEGFNAADASQIGTRGLARQQAAEDAIEGDRAARLTVGYTQLAEYLRARVQAAGATLLLNTPLASVDWQPGQVAITTADGDQHHARTLIVTLPLGVLLAGSVRFSPEPRAPLAAARLLASGAVQRIVLRFRTRFWAERAPAMRFLFTEDEMPPTWWTTAPHESTLLAGWVGGPRALRITNAEAVRDSALASLEGIFALPAGSLRHELISWHTHDWQRDPYSLGAYSYALKGGSRAADALAQPVGKTLFFAGEHTDITGHPGTVHGAMRSGLRAAAQVAAEIAAQVTAKTQIPAQSART